MATFKPKTPSKTTTSKTTKKKTGVPSGITSKAKFSEVMKQKKMDVLTYQYIGHGNLGCPGCMPLSPGMIGTFDPQYKDPGGRNIMYFMFPNGFLLDQPWLEERTDLFKKVSVNA